MRFLHLADIHLDSPFASATEALRTRLREATREALRRGVDLAIRERVHAVLIAGDLLDGETLSFRTELFLLEELKRLEGCGIPVVYATGNHDPGSAQSRARAIPWPPNVTVMAGPTPTTAEIRGGAGKPVGRVTGSGHPSGKVTEDLSRAFPPPGEEGAQVALLHTQVMGSASAEGHHPYAPSELAALRRMGFHYWALGHVHLRQELSRNPPIHYPGNIQGRSPRETGAKGGLLVDLQRPGEPRVDFHSLAPVRWETLDVRGLEDAASPGALLRKAHSAWEALRRNDPGEPGTEWFLRVVLSGACPLWREVRHPDQNEELGNLVAGELGLLRAEIRGEEVTPLWSPEEFLHRQDGLGEALRLLHNIRSQAEPLPREWAEGLARLQLLGEELSPEALEELLAGGEAELLVRMLEESP